jgi:hypothetical protein
MVRRDVFHSNEIIFAHSDPFVVGFLSALRCLFRRSAGAISKGGRAVSRIVLAAFSDLMIFILYRTRCFYDWTCIVYHSKMR